jgi:hypothetical protein
MMLGCADPNGSTWRPGSDLPRRYGVALDAGRKCLGRDVAATSMSHEVVFEP